MPRWAAVLHIPAQRPGVLAPLPKAPRCTLQHAVHPKPTFGPQRRKLSRPNRCHASVARAAADSRGIILLEQGRHFGASYSISTGPRPLCWSGVFPEPSQLCIHFRVETLANPARDSGPRGSWWTRQAPGCFSRDFVRPTGPLSVARDHHYYRSLHNRRSSKITSLLVLVLWILVATFLRSSRCVSSLGRPAHENSLRLPSSSQHVPCDFWRLR